MALIKTNARSSSQLDATILTGNLPAISGASLIGVPSASAKNFQAKLTSDVSSKNNNTWYYLGYSAGFGITESVDNGSMWDASNGFFVAPDTGQYLFYLAWACYGTSTHDSYDIGYAKLQKAASGSSSFSNISGYDGERTGNRTPNKGYVAGNFSQIVSLTAGERIIFGTHVYSGGSQTDWEWGEDGTYFGGIYLGD